MPPATVDLCNTTHSDGVLQKIQNHIKHYSWNWMMKSEKQAPLLFCHPKEDKEEKEKKKKKSWGILTVHLRSGLTFLMIPWKAWDNGPWPKSWQRPATWTHRTSLPVIFNSGCLIRSEQTSSPAKWHTLKRTATFISPMYGLGSWSAAIMHWSALYLQPNSILNRPP